MNQRETLLQALRYHILRCKECMIKNHYGISVPFEGNINSPIMFIGRDPGRDEIALGRPFVGAAGQELDSMLSDLGVSRSDIYITNVIKCRPKNNKPAKLEEYEFCGNRFLLREITLIRPTVIVAMGTEAATYLLKSNSRISDLRGKSHQLKSGIIVVPTWHPSFIVRMKTYNRERYPIHRSEFMNDVSLAFSFT